MSIFPDLLKFLAPALVLSLVWVVGAVYALATYPRHKAVSLTALIGCCVLLINALGGGVATWWLLQQQFSSGWSASQSSLSMSALNLLRTSVSVLGYVLLLVAVFGWRSAPRPPWERRELTVEGRIGPAEVGGDPEGIRRPGRGG